MLIVEHFLNGKNVCLKEVVRTGKEKNSTIKNSKLGNTHGESRRSSHIDHGGDDDVLFNGEWPRVKCNSKHGNIRQVTSPGFANGETQHHGNGLFVQGLILKNEVEDSNAAEKTQTIVT